jgi:hypothetical protein
MIFSRKLILFFLLSSSGNVWAMMTDLMIGKTVLECVAEAINQQDVNLLKTALLRCERERQQFDATQLVNQLALYWIQENTLIKKMFSVAAAGTGIAGFCNEFELGSWYCQQAAWGLAAATTFYTRLLLAKPEERFFELVQLLITSSLVIIEQQDLSQHAVNLMANAQKYMQERELCDGVIVSADVWNKYGGK